jgi:exoribonuclease R
MNNEAENTMYWYDKILNENSIEKQNLVNYNFLKWKEDSSNRGNYFLTSDDGKIGSLTMLNKKGTSAVGIINGNKFFIKKKGFLTEQFEVSEESTNRKLTASLENVSGEEEILTFDKKKIYWKQLKKMEDDWMFLNENKDTLVYFKPVSSFHLSGYSVDIMDSKKDKDILPFLLLLGLYNVITVADKMSVDTLLL